MLYAVEFFVDVTDVTDVVQKFAVWILEFRNCLM